MMENLSSWTSAASCDSLYRSLGVSTSPPTGPGEPVVVDQCSLLRLTLPIARCEHQSSHWTRRTCRRGPVQPPATHSTDRSIFDSYSAVWRPRVSVEYKYRFNSYTAVWRPRVSVEYKYRFNSYSAVWRPRVSVEYKHRCNSYSAVWRPRVSVEYKYRFNSYTAV
ncbi:hypothetical protein RRG08_033634 [Elysia crispata]|uniref:Uncharacterized protein n=1 Tax=Elysia crispata TaxID=231223 RepID=A0AAE1CKU6_9GAST|nr:hypothetical protein RRG08_033634 [Elysia crispata]